MADRVVATLGDSIVRESDSALLDGPFWLSDRLIAFYFEHLHRTNFEGSEKLCFLSPEVSQFLKLVGKEEVAAFVDPLNLEEKEVILMAVNDASDPTRPGGSHWSLLVYTSQAGKFHHLDSCPGTNLQHARQMAQKIHEFLTDTQKKSGTRASSDLQFKEVDAVKQKNCYDCGVHVLLNAEHATRHFFVYGHHLGLELIDPDQVKGMRAKIKAMQRTAPVISKARGRHTATLIFLHGLGDTGHGWAATFNAIKPSYLKVICPTAPTAPVTLNGGMAMPSWYDIFSLDDGDESRPREDIEGVMKSSKNLDELVVMEAETNVPRDRIMIGGFSQGGAVALSTLLRDSRKPNLAGCLALSTYLPGNKAPEVQGKIETSILQCHGESDTVIPLRKGRQASNILQTLATDCRFHTFRHMGHESDMRELEVIKSFMVEKLGS